MEETRGKSRSIIANIDNAVKFFSLPPYKRRKKQLVQIMNLIKFIPFFSKYIDNGWPDVVYQCLEHMQIQVFNPDTVIFEQGSVGELFYIILEGQVGVFVNVSESIDQMKDSFSQQYSSDSYTPSNSSPLTREKQVRQCVKVLESGESFGELALIYNRPRLASIITFTNTYVAVLDKRAFRNIVREKEQQQILKDIQYLIKLPYFDSQNHSLLREIHINFNPITVHQGQIIFAQGDVSKAIFLIRSGQFEVFKTINHYWRAAEGEDSLSFFKSYTLLKGNDRRCMNYIDVPLCLAGVNELFGEEDLIRRRRRTFSVRCVSGYGELLFMKRSQFFTKVTSYPSSLKMLRDISELKLNAWSKQEDLFKAQLSQNFSYLVGDRHKLLYQSRLKELVQLQSQKTNQSRLQNQQTKDKSIPQSCFIYQPDEKQFITESSEKAKTQTSSEFSPEREQLKPPKLTVKYKPPLLKKVDQPSIGEAGFHLKKYDISNLDGYNVMQATMKVKKQISQETPYKHEKLSILHNVAQDQAKQIARQQEQVTRTKQPSLEWGMVDKRDKAMFDDQLLKLIGERIPKKIEVLKRLEKDGDKLEQDCYKVEEGRIKTKIDFLREKRKREDQKGVSFSSKFKERVIKKIQRYRSKDAISQFSTEELIELIHSLPSIHVPANASIELAQRAGALLEEFKRIVRQSQKEEQTYWQEILNLQQQQQQEIDQNRSLLINRKVVPLVFKRKQDCLDELEAAEIIPKRLPQLAKESFQNLEQDKERGVNRRRIKSMICFDYSIMSTVEQCLKIENRSWSMQDLTVHHEDDPQDILSEHNIPFQKVVQQNDSLIISRHKLNSEQEVQTVQEGDNQADSNIESHQIDESHLTSVKQKSGQKEKKIPQLYSVKTITMPIPSASTQQSRHFILYQGKKE